MSPTRDQSPASCSGKHDDACFSRLPDCRSGHRDSGVSSRSCRRGVIRTLLLSSVLLWLQARLSLAVTPLSQWQSGIATNYGGPYDGKNPYDPSWGTLDGSCGYGKLDKAQWPYWSVAALSSSSSFVQAGPINACGQCFEVKCVDTPPFQGRCITGANQVSVIVQITDICPECAADHIDIQALTYNKLSKMETGRINVMYRRVECVPPKPMVIYVDNNGGQGAWLRLFIEQAGGAAAVKQVQVRTSGSTDGYTNLNNKWGSDWETSNAPKFPLDINIVGADGDSVTAYQVIQNAGATGKMPTSVQFKISNPGDQALTAAVNSDGSSTSVAARGDSLAAPGAAPSGSPASAGSNGGCTDTPPSSAYTCEQQKGFNACSQSWMSAGNFCAQTCGRCSGSGSSSSPGTSGSPSWSPSPSGSPSWSPSPSGSPSWSPSPNWSPSPSPSWSPSPSPSWSPSNSPSWSPSNSPSWSPSNSPSWSPSNSPSWSQSNSPSWSQSNSPNWSPSPSWSQSNSPSPSNSPSWSQSNSPSWSPSPNSYASGGRKLLVPGRQYSGTVQNGEDGRLVLTIAPQE